MAFGVTSSGFVLKRLSDIQAETQQAFKSAFGNGIDLDPRRPLGQVKAILDERDAKIWELMQAVYNSQYPNTAEGINLDNVVAITGVKRRSATRSTIGSGTARGTFGTVIPAGTIVSVDGDDTAKFETVSAVTIDVAAVDETQEIEFSAVPDDGNWQIQAEDELSVTLSELSTATDVQNAINGLTLFSAVTVTGNFTDGFEVTFAGADGGQDQPTLTVVNNTLEAATVAVTATVTVTQEGDRAKAEDISLIAQNTGPVAAPSGSLTVIETLVAGLDSFTNELDATVGTNSETDAELKLRRSQQLRTSAASTVEAIKSNLLDLDDVTSVIVLQNNTDVTDARGVPPHFIEVILLGGTDDDIKAALFDSVAAGIGYFGNVSTNLTDSQGFTQTVKYSRPSEVPIYLEVDLTVDANFPADGTDQAEAAFLAFGNELSIGDDVIVYPKLICAIESIPGILDVAIRIKRDTAGPTLDDNIEIDFDEISDWDSSRITVITV